MKRVFINIASIIFMVLGALIAMLFGFCTVLCAFTETADITAVFVFLTICGAALFWAGWVLKNHHKIKKPVSAATSKTLLTSSEDPVSHEEEKKLVSVVCVSCGGVTKLTEGEKGTCEYCDSPIHG